MIELTKNEDNILEDLIDCFRDRPYYTYWWFSADFYEGNNIVGAFVFIGEEYEWNIVKVADNSYVVTGIDIDCDCGLEYCKLYDDLTQAIKYVFMMVDNYINKLEFNEDGWHIDG